MNISGPLCTLPGMAALTQLELLEKLREAQQKILLTGQEVTIDDGQGGRTTWRGADLAAINAEVQRLERATVGQGQPASPFRIGGLSYAQARFD